MIPTSKFVLNRTSREITKDIYRQISKTSSVTTSDVIARNENKNLELNTGDRNTGNNKWNKLSKLNNIRALSTIQTKSKPAVNSQLFSKEESREFLAVFPDIVRDLTDAGRHTDIPEVTKRFVKVLQYNVPTGKKTRGLSTVVAYKMLEKPENLTPENIRLANIMGWCVELFRGFNCISDDLISNSEIRRQMPCWYRQENVGMKAISDCEVLQYSPYSIMRKYLSDLPCYVPLMEMFHDVSMKTALGKSLEGLISDKSNLDLKNFTMKKYNLILKYRSGLYSFQLPVGSAMFLANMYDPEQHRQAKTIVTELGEVFQIQIHASFVTHDDVMDNAAMRRGQKSWYKTDGVGLMAINDGILLENSAFSILRRHFSNHECYVPVMELFHDVILKTSLGQMLDGMCMKDGRPDLDKFTMKRYNAIIKYKTAYYTFQLPVAVAMNLAKMFNEEQHRQAKTILMEIGEFYQIQDDFLDCFGDKINIGKDGTDIKEGKCSWLAVVALQRANSSQRKIMEEHYGRPELESQQIIKNLYEELHLPATFAVYEEESFNIIRTHIQQISKGLPHDLFFKIIKKIYKRDC